MSEGVRKLILRLSGAMLVVLGILHLAVTPLVAAFIEHNTSGESGQRLEPPMLLNQVVVGILLLPLGAITYYAAPFAAVGERWALVVTRCTAVTVATLPFVLFSIMGGNYFGALPFLAATILVSAAAVILLAAAFWGKG